MTDIIELPRHSTPLTIHYGSQANYERFIGTAYFICDDDDDDGSQQNGKKYSIMEVVYAPDDLYKTNDGYAGSCWKVNVIDGENGSSATYLIRNWIDIVQYYRIKGFKFVESEN